ncbi:hypothetical protein FA95DRAFT_1553346 [Auriscalpium vulgare]|uniref:Uncharacterized protein n=1 Tax=Auriscalpium vulgare TaxID=40419 RepID=A0ACB8S7U8_9AGAM|nr:hypothetical protein FA95DRAFT_1553346 [Auriscalpium vulgare]
MYVIIFEPMRRTSQQLAFCPPSRARLFGAAHAMAGNEAYSNGTYFTMTTHNGRFTQVQTDTGQ